MQGKWLVGGIFGIAAIFGVAFFYFQVFAHYNTVDNVTEIDVFGDAFPVRHYQGIDAESSPLKMRACFDVDWDYYPDEEFRYVATPLIAPFWFNCFDAEQIEDDIRNVEAVALLADTNRIYGFDRYIAHYPDGRAYMWRQINACGEALYGGELLPAGCPEPSADLLNN